MGCDSPDSNWNHYIYNPESKSWGCAWGLLYRVTAPTKELVIERIGQARHPMMVRQLIEGDDAGWYDAIELEDTDLPAGIYFEDNINLVRTNTDGKAYVESYDGLPIPAGIYRDITSSVHVDAY